MRELRVGLKGTAYPILIGDGLLREPAHWAHIAGDAAVVVTQPRVEDEYAQVIAEHLGETCRGVYVLPDGETHKTLEDLQGIYQYLLERNLGRDACLIAVGGGMVGDMTGFAAATYMRGIRYIQVPTTLLAQVDASVGGKTGVNHPLGKNMIGAFWQPQAVLIDPVTLATLPERELRAGVAEVIKYGLLGDAPFFAWLEEHIDAVLAKEPEALAQAIETSCACKARVVEADELESSGQRALLNLGHTFAHAIETEQNYQQWLHGEAVACGMVLAADLSVRQGWLDQEQAERARALIERTGLPVRVPEDLTVDRLKAHMSHDKKNQGGRQRFVLMHAIGDAELTDQVDMELLEETLRAYGAGA